MLSGFVNIYNRALKLQDGIVNIYKAGLKVLPDIENNYNAVISSFSAEEANER